jgi:hypothetical protein
VPYGHKKNHGPTVTLENFREISRHLQSAKLTSLDFQKSIETIKQRTFIYCDPVYTSVLSERFDRYNAAPFTLNCHSRLASTTRRLVESTDSTVVVSLPFDEAFPKIYGDGFWVGMARSGRYGLGKRSEKLHFELLWIYGRKNQPIPVSQLILRNSNYGSFNFLGYSSSVPKRSDLLRWRNRYFSNL